MKIYNMLAKRYVSNADADFNCLLIFKDRKEIKDSCGYFPSNLPMITEDKLENDSPKAIEDYLDKVEKADLERYELEKRQHEYNYICHKK